MADNEIIQALLSVGNTLVSIESIMRECHDASQSIQQEAKTVFEAHKLSAQQYFQTVDQPDPIDTHPFVELPVGTTVRDLPNGNRVFLLVDSTHFVVNSDGTITGTSNRGGYYQSRTYERGPSNAG